jgi:hypothetical protein
MIGERRNDVTNAIPIQRIEIDPQGKQILVLREFTVRELEEAMTAMRQWMESDKPIFVLNLRGERAVELIKVENGG